MEKCILNFLCAFFISLNEYYLIGALLYLLIFQIVRLRFVGCNAINTNSINAGPIVDNNWWKMWKKDVVQTENYSANERGLYT